MNFEAKGPFIIPRDRHGRVSTDELNSFWDAINSKDTLKLSEACGCYIFAVKAGKGVLPWYVGKAEKRSFQKECFTDRNILLYNNLVLERKGTPVLFLLPRMTGTGKKYSRPTTAKYPAVAELETLLISMAFLRNPDILNKQKTRMLRDLKVKGLVNDRKTTKGSPGELRELLLGKGG